MNKPITKKSGRPSSRQAILAAAAQLVVEEGASHLTLDAVAARAGVSKGGLLYNFPNKTALLSAMIEDSVAEATAMLQSGEQNGGRGLAAQICALFEQRFAWLFDCLQERSSVHGMLAAVAEQPALLEPVRRFQQMVWAKIKDIVPDPDRLWIMWLGLDGMLFAQLFSMTPLSIEERERVFNRLRIEIETQLSTIKDAS